MRRTYKRLFDALHGTAVSCSPSHIGVTTTLSSLQSWLVGTIRLSIVPVLTLQSHLCSVHLPLAPPDPKPSPNSHSYAPWYFFPSLIGVTHSVEIGQPSNILYSYLHTNYVNLSSTLLVILLMFYRILKTIF